MANQQLVNPHDIAKRHKYLVYKSHGQRGYDMLDRLISEEQLKVEKVPREYFPEGLYIDDEAPAPMRFDESLSFVERYRDEVFKPGFSIICLIYKNVEWLKFVYQQVMKNTDMHGKEFFFVANDANDAVLSYLRDNYIPHYIHRNTARQKKEWFINNVYRAYNFAARKARGDFLVFINSDMAFAPGWLDNLWKAYTGSNCVASRLIESGKLRSGTYGIEKNFGSDFNNFREADFLQYASGVAVSMVNDSGLFMPLLVRKDHFNLVGGYPEGNIIPGSDIFSPVIAKKGQLCISGDNVLIERLKAKGIIHQTAFDSLVYHFQCGESDGQETAEPLSETPKVAVCNDLVTGSMGERVLWNFMLEALPGSVGIDTRVIGKSGDYAKNARTYIKRHYPDVKVIIQNASFINTVDESVYTISFLQDNLRTMNCPVEQQERNLQKARKLVANSVHTSLAYPEYEFEIIPVGVDSSLFRPANKSQIRSELGLEPGRVGIFVGDFSEVKGWSKVRECIDHFTEITWLIVSKGAGSYNAPNAHVFTRIPQEFLVKLLNAADFFIIGSPIETQCLAAVEACLCNIPVIMRNVGVFRELSITEKAQVGIFGEDFISAVRIIPERSFSPRQVMIDKKLTVRDSMDRWSKLLEGVFQEIMLEQIKGR